MINLADQEHRYTRSTDAAKGKRPEILETTREVSHEYSKTIRVSDGGVYEVVAVKDKYCSFSSQHYAGRPGQKLLTN